MICWRNSASAAQKPRPSSGLLTGREASEILGVAESTVWDMTAKGWLQRIGKRGPWHLYLRSDVEALAEKRRLQAERLKERKRKWRVRT
jgi:predicted DNA-binding transcriptional regulator AlpA